MCFLWPFSLFLALVSFLIWFLNRRYSFQSASLSNKQRAESSNCWFNCLEEFRNFSGALLQTTQLSPGCITTDLVQEWVFPQGRHASLPPVVRSLWLSGPLCSLKHWSAISSNQGKRSPKQACPLSERRHQDAWPHQALGKWYTAFPGISQFSGRSFAFMACSLSPQWYFHYLVFNFTELQLRLVTVNFLCLGVTEWAPLITDVAMQNLQCKLGDWIRFPFCMNWARYGFSF